MTGPQIRTRLLVTKVANDDSFSLAQLVWSRVQQDGDDKVTDLWPMWVGLCSDCSGGGTVVEVAPDPNGGWSLSTNHGDGSDLCWSLQVCGGKWRGNLNSADREGLGSGVVNRWRWRDSTGCGGLLEVKWRWSVVVELVQVVARAWGWCLAVQSDGYWFRVVDVWVVGDAQPGSWSWSCLVDWRWGSWCVGGRGCSAWRLVMELFGWSTMGLMFLGCLAKRGPG